MVINGGGRVMHFPQSLREAQGKMFVAPGKVKMKKKKEVTPQPLPLINNEQSLTNPLLSFS